jgi:hypothetical protein
MQLVKIPQLHSRCQVILFAGLTGGLRHARDVREFCVDSLGYFQQRLLLLYGVYQDVLTCPRHKASHRQDRTTKDIFCDPLPEG